TTIRNLPSSTGSAARATVVERAAIEMARAASRERIMGGSSLSDGRPVNAIIRSESERHREASAAADSSASLAKTRFFQCHQLFVSVDDFWCGDERKILFQHDGFEVIEQPPKFHRA